MKEKFEFKQELLKLGFDNLLVDQWMLIRLNQSNTKRSFNSFLNEIANFAPEEYNRILKHIVTKRWIGFKAKWILKPEKISAIESNENIFDKINILL